MTTKEWLEFISNFNNKIGLVGYNQNTASRSYTSTKRGLSLHASHFERSDSKLHLHTKLEGNVCLYKFCISKLYKF